MDLPEGQKRRIYKNIGERERGKLHGEDISTGQLTVLEFRLKVVGNEKWGGSGICQLIE